MACATLKRSLDFDPVHSHGRPSKRRRCVPMCVSPKPNENDTPSHFGEVTPKLTPEKLAANIREELRRLHRRRQLSSYPGLTSMDGGGGGSSSGPDSSSDSAMESPASPTSSLFSSMYPGAASGRDKPLFTFRQINMICERMMAERETQIREEYDRTLTNKLAEQYDTFVKFTYDQIQKRFEMSTVPSYLS